VCFGNGSKAGKSKATTTYRWVVGAETARHPCAKHLRERMRVVLDCCRPTDVNVGRGADFAADLSQRQRCHRSGRCDAADPMADPVRQQLL